MAKKKENANTEQLILDAAEDEFLEKGFSRAKTTSIAKKAGVTHAMLHYYFRTKENLFQVVFLKKVQIAANSFEVVFKEDTQSLESTIRAFVERHFDFISTDPRLVNFVYNEVMHNKENRELLFKALLPRLQIVIGHVEAFIARETAKGTMRKVKALDLLLNSAYLNIATFMLFPIVKEYMPGQANDLFEAMLKERRESNVQFILNAVKA